MKWSFMISFLFYLVTLILVQNEVSCNGCLESERIGLLDIKHFILSHLKDSDYYSYGENELGSWVDERRSNCCTWNRVECSNITFGHITQLSLHNLLYTYPLNVMLNVSLFRPFEELRLLNLRDNSFAGFSGNTGFPRLRKLETLDLSENSLNDSILPSLNGLIALTTLNLGSNNIFSAQGFPPLKMLETLDLSLNKLDGKNLSSLNGLASLTTLNLGGNQMNINFSTFSTEGFSQLKKLKTLDLSGNNLDGKNISSLNGLVSLTTLNLDGNPISINFFAGDVESWRSLEILSLRDNSMIITIEGVQNWRNLKKLGLSVNCLSDSVKGLCKLKNLVELEICDSMVGAPLPECLSNLTNLKVLNIVDNFISGSFPSFISNLTALKYLSLYGNYMQGSFSLSTLANHSKLEALFVSSKSNGAHVETEEVKWFPKFQLKYLIIRNCNLNKDKGNVIPSFLSYQYNLILIVMSSNKMVGSFPSWLKHNDGLHYLDISNNSFSGWLPKDIGRFLPTVIYLKISGNSFEGNIPPSIGKMKELRFLDLSHNHFSGHLPKQLAIGCIDLEYLKLSNNFLQGNIPKFSKSMNMLFLNNNNFSGTLEDLLGNDTQLALLDISNNSISGTIPSSIGKCRELLVLLMNENLLEGSIPVEISDITFLQVLDLSQNKLMGSIQNLNTLIDLNYLHLQNNNLSGSIPFEISGNSLLQVLDLRNNQFSGKIPNWVDNLSNLIILLLGGNNLEGDIPIQLCRLKKMNIMDLSRNMLKSSIPSCFQNLSFGQYGDDGDFSIGIVVNTFSLERFKDSFLTQDAMEVPDELFNIYNVEQVMKAEFRTKNNFYSYKGKTLTNMTGLDLSCNKLTGIIPSQIGDLQQIKSLNLSHNFLSGHIPITFSNLTQIESLDLSFNNLSGKIPNELTQLNYLAIFNVSYNNFSGTPPTTEQFADFDEENYKGNPGLCGPLLNRKCVGVPSPPSSHSIDNGEKETKVDMVSFYWSFGASYITILLSIITVLYINAHWRMVWFYFISNIIRKCFPNFPILY